MGEFIDYPITLPDGYPREEDRMSLSDAEAHELALWGKKLLREKEELLRSLNKQSGGGEVARTFLRVARGDSLTMMIEEGYGEMFRAHLVVALAKEVIGMAEGEAGGRIASTN